MYIVEIIKHNTRIRIRIHNHTESSDKREHNLNVYIFQERETPLPPLFPSGRNGLSSERFHSTLLCAVISQSIYPSIHPSKYPSCIHTSRTLHCDSLTSFISPPLLRGHPDPRVKCPEEDRRV